MEIQRMVVIGPDGNEETRVVARIEREEIELHSSTPNGRRSIVNFKLIPKTYDGEEILWTMGGLPHIVRVR